MKVITETNLRGFNAWSGAVDTKNLIISLGLEEEFEMLIDELYEEGLTDTQLNDLLWFESDWILENLVVSAPQIPL